MSVDMFDASQNEKIMKNTAITDVKLWLNYGYHANMIIYEALTCRAYDQKIGDSNSRVARVISASCPYERPLTSSFSRGWLTLGFS